MSKLPFGLESDVSLAGLTTLGVGGRARFLAWAADGPALVAALAWAEKRGMPVFVLGGGSNLLVADSGFDGLVLRFTGSRLAIEDDGETARVTAAAGLAWDALVARLVAAGLGGVECLSGIPGDVGAAPIQNIGAYGQNVSESLTWVHGIDRSTGHLHRLAAQECGFGYRTSHFKRAWRDRFVVTAIELALPRTARGSVRYRDLVERFSQATAASDAGPTVAAVRAAVLAVRGEKSMVLSDDDPNRRSAGSFFTNPVVSERLANAVADARDVAFPTAARTGAGMPRFEQPDGSVKLSAAWLIEAAGYARGTTCGRVGLSSRHALAVINRGGASASEVISFAGEIRARVRERFGVTLVPEPALLGFEGDTDTVFDGHSALGNGRLFDRTTGSG